MYALICKWILCSAKLSNILSQVVSNKQFEFRFKGERKEKQVYLLMYVQAWKFIKHKMALENSFGITFFVCVLKSCWLKFIFSIADMLHQLRHSTFPVQTPSSLYISRSVSGCRATDCFSFIGADKSVFRLGNCWCHRCWFSMQASSNRAEAAIFVLVDQCQFK